MENQQEQEQQNLPIDKIGGVMIGVHKYNSLKAIAYENLTDEQKKQIYDYENSRTIPVVKVDNLKKYVSRMLAPEKETVYKFTADELLELFKVGYKKMFQKDFVLNQETEQNIKPLIYYFSKDDRFFECENLTRLSEPNFNKGLLIMGNFGNGKTSTMKVFEQIFKSMDGFRFKGFSATQVVQMYEKCIDDDSKDKFEKMMFNGNRYFDDLKTERYPNNYGRVNIFKDILENRSDRNLKTHITCNYKDGFEGDVQAGLLEFVDKYGKRVGDRLFSEHNILVFNGKSFRR